VDGIEKNWAKPNQFGDAKMPPYAADQQGNPDSGRKLFLRNCFMCHGPGAKVGPVADPTYLSLVSDQMLRTSIIVGRPDLGMPDYRSLKLGKPLADQDIADLVAFLASKRPANSSFAQSSTIRENSPTNSYQTHTGNKSTGGSSQQGIK
jgi:mono/diheme cytochrome c family protein